MWKHLTLWRKIPPDMVQPQDAPQHNHKMYDDCVNEEAFARDLVLTIINHGISWDGAAKIVKVVNRHVYDRRLTNKLPATAYQLKLLTECSPGHAKLYPVCAQCDFVFNHGQAQCLDCGLAPARNGKRQLLINDVAVRIRQMYANKNLAKALQYATTRATGDGDVWDGEMLRDIPPGQSSLLMRYVVTLLDVRRATVQSAILGKLGWYRFLFSWQ
jgi:hypothetical protein